MTLQIRPRSRRHGIASRLAPHVAPGWADEFVLELRLRGIVGPRIDDALSEVESHCAESDETAQEAFGDAVDYARSLGLSAETDTSPRALLRSVAPTAPRTARSPLPSERPHAPPAMRPGGGIVDAGHRRAHSGPMEGRRVPWARMTWKSAAYVTTVALCATLGFVDRTPWPVLLAAAISFPASIVTLPGYYVVYGLLAMVPGVDPSRSSGSGSFDAGGHLLSSVTTGTPAAWFTTTTPVIGILALAVGALVNVRLTRVLAARRRHRVADAPL